MHATPASGSIIVRALTTAVIVRVEVIATGQGMSAEALHYALGHATHPASAQSTCGRADLRLRLSQFFAQTQGGTLRLRSTPGQGTTATLELRPVGA